MQKSILEQTVQRVGVILEDLQAARKILDTLKESRSFIILRTLARKAGFPGVQSKDFKKGFKFLQKRGIVKLQHTGWKAEGYHHPVVILVGDIYDFEEQILEEITNVGDIKEPTDDLVDLEVLEPKFLKNRTLNNTQKEKMQLFFNFLYKKNLKAAKETLKEIKSLFPEIQWFKGLYMSLSGMLSAERGKYIHPPFIKEINTTDVKQLKRYKKKFKGESRSQTHALYDRGFFVGWYLFIDFLITKQSTES